MQILLNSTLSCVDKTVENLRKLGVDPSDIKAIGITNQRETIIAWDKLTGEPLYNAIGMHIYFVKYSNTLEIYSSVYYGVSSLVGYKNSF